MNCYLQMHHWNTWPWDLWVVSQVLPTLGSAQMPLPVHKGCELNYSPKNQNLANVKCLFLILHHSQWVLKSPVHDCSSLILALKSHIFSKFCHELYSIMHIKFAWWGWFPIVSPLKKVKSSLWSNTTNVSTRNLRLVTIIRLLTSLNKAFFPYHN